MGTHFTAHATLIHSTLNRPADSVASTRLLLHGNWCFSCFSSCFLSSSLLAASVLSGTTTQQVCKCWQLQQAHTTPEHTHGILLMSFLPLSSLTFRSPSPPFTQHATHASAASSQRFLLLQAGFIHCFLCVFRWACFSLCGNVHLCVCVCTHTHLRRVEVCETQRQSCPLLPRSYCCPTEMTRRLIRERERETER